MVVTQKRRLSAGEPIQHCSILGECLTRFLVEQYRIPTFKTDAGLSCSIAYRRFPGPISSRNSIDSFLLPQKHKTGNSSAVPESNQNLNRTPHFPIHTCYQEFSVDPDPAPMNAGDAGECGVTKVVCATKPALCYMIRSSINGTCLPSHSDRQGIMQLKSAEDCTTGESSSI